MLPLRESPGPKAPGSSVTQGVREIARAGHPVALAVADEQLASLALVLQNPETSTVPIGNANYLTSAGDAVLWNRPQALRLFNDLRTDQPVPHSLLSGSHLAA